jgi:hypothetical protein
MQSNCDKEWSRKFLRDHFPNTFLTKKYKDHLSNVLFDQEKSLMPATQPLVENKKKMRQIRDEITRINQTIDDLRDQKMKLERAFLMVGRKENEEETNNRKFVRQCPANECRGFLSTQWKCGLCEQWTCPECHELKGLNRDCEHICDPNSVETAKLLEKDSKPCPNCHSLIFKISGCTQMWCTQCHHAFNWITLKAEHNIHNPHYYEWQRKNNATNAANANANQPNAMCEPELSHNTSNHLLRLAKNNTALYNNHSYDTKIIYISGVINNVIHNNYAELPRYRTDYLTRNQELRIRYLENTISEEEFKVLLQRNDKKNKKNTEISQVITLFNTAVKDIVYRILHHLSSCPNNINLDPFLDEIEQIQTHCNDIFKDISFTYNSVLLKFNNHGVLGTV